MGTVRVISTAIVQAPPSYDDDDSPHTTIIHLTPWDLQFLHFEPLQQGLLFPYFNNKHHTPFHIQHLKHSLSATLSFFPPLAGRLAILQHQHNTVSSHILCNNKGVLFVHAVADNVAIADILQSSYVPPIVHSFFPLNGVKNHEGTSQPPLAVQVTELLDGVFIGFTINHVVADNKSLWHFINSWAEISRGSLTPSKLIPSFQRYFPDGIHPPIRFPFTKEEKDQSQGVQPERVFHFTKEKIAQLKSKANAEIGTDKISSLQALLTHLWRSVLRCQILEAQEEVRYVLTVDARTRIIPPLPEDYFGNVVLVGGVSMKAGELVESGGLGKGAWEMNKMICLYTDEKIKNEYECWLRIPKMVTVSSVASSNSLSTSSSPRFDVYGNDFGWGKPLAVRCGGANKRNGKVTLFAGAEAGSIDIIVSLAHEILEALGNYLSSSDA